MPETEVLYSDVKFTKKKGDTTEAASSSIEATYSEIKISKTQPSTELPECSTASQQAVSNEGSKVKSKKVALVILCVLLAVVVIALCYVYYHHMQTKKKCQTLTTEYEDLEKNVTGDSKCDKGWLQHGGKCYFFSTTNSSWEESRCYCQIQGGDLVKIDSMKEQTFLTNELSDKMKYEEDKFWIGLTDSKEENKWFWVDDSPLNTSLSFWRKDEPDNWKGENPEGEDCVRMGEKGRPAELKCWSDKSCDVPQRRICEKQALNWI
ncbi:C-type lectin domain family 4 member E-like [Thunnus thynnus]|uniref:C-type lectin domain family 4 member E-like n=1 Tax=Thunnus thynnus TaxID=8237 RepID=UPI00352958B2